MVATAFLAVGAVAVASVYGLLKSMKWGISAENNALGAEYANEISDVFRVSVLAVVALVLGPPAGGAVADGVRYLAGLIV